MVEIKDKVLKNSFKIENIEVYALKIPLKNPIKMSGVTVSKAENIFIKITSSSGLYGWGEASSAPTMTGEFVEGMYAAGNFIKEHLIGVHFKNLFDVNLLKKLPVYENKGTLSAFEIILESLIISGLVPNKVNTLSFI